MAVSGRYMLCVRCKYLIVVLLMFFHRKCLGQVSFDCGTLQPQPANNFIPGTPEETMQYTVTVDQQYYQQSSTRRVFVNSGSLAFTSLYLQARNVVTGSSIGGWSSPYPSGYTITAGCHGLDSIIKVGVEPAQAAVFEWTPPFADTSIDVMFVATFVNGGKFYIMMSETITDPCNPSPCSPNEICFRGTASPGYHCADACAAVTCQNGGTCTIQNGEAECVCPEGLTGNTCESCEEDFCQNGGICIINSGEQPQCLCPSSYMGTRCQFLRGGSSSACGSNPCQNGGSCGLQTDGNYICSCSNGFYGTRCENANTFCLIQGCLNGGTCNPIGSSAGSCICAEGFTGAQCEGEDPCFNFCQNGGICIDGGNVATCQCPVGFQGIRCETPSDEFCSLNWCQNGATCLPFTDGVGGFCMCPSGFSGPYCDEPENTFCSQSPCLNGGECLNLAMGAGQCKCTTDFTGALCEEPMRQGCSPNNCQNGGTCVSISSTGSQCQCVDGYTGSHCEEMKGFCSFNLCRNGATCVDTGISGHCICAEGFTGADCGLTDFCDHGLCQNGATCENTETSGYCVCAEGFTGAACDVVDTPDFCDHGLCQNGATCVNTETSGYCMCAEGFTGAACDEMDIPGFCSFGFCQNGATCIETANGGSCLCAEGFTGFTCDSSQDRCSPNPCFNGGNCFPMEEEPFILCVCALGFTGDLCQVVETPCTSEPCQNGGTCSVTQGSPSGYICQCASPYVGTNCETVSPCLSGPCQNGGTCSVSPGSPVGYSCQCRNFYLGTNCETVSPCLSGPCQNGGTCSVSPGSPVGYSCQCRNFYLGTNCETVSPCNSSPCSNGGQCTPLGESFNCTCQGFWRGDRCDMEDYCRSRQPCENGGTCLFTGHATYQCQCLPTFTGQNCQFANPCIPSPCRNRATCSVISFSDFRCNCPLQFFGRNCELPNPCASNPCLSGGTCQPSDDGSSYRCECLPGFTGIICHNSAGDACSNSQCVNGTCEADAVSARNYRCVCQEGFGGEFCDSVVDVCLAHKPCLNGGTCINQGSSSSSCTCMDPFFGDSCLFSMDNGPEFQDCVDTTHTYQLRPDNTAYVNLNITARVPETGQVIDFDIIVGPNGVTFPGIVTYTEDYLVGQRFELRARDQFDRESSCSFTIKLSDPIAPTVKCPGDHEDISSKDRVVVSSLPLPLIEASDNIGLPADDVFTYSPEEVNVDGQSREVTVSVYDVDGNRAECQFGLTIYKGGECSSISTDNGRINCSVNSARNRACEIRCNEGFLTPNGDLYTCRNNNWDKVPLPCLAIQEPNSFSKRITFVFSVKRSLCVQDEFLIDVTEAMKAKLTDLDLCGQGSSVSACGENSISASCDDQSAQNLRRKRQTTESEVEIDVEISGSSRDDVTDLITSIEEVINEGFAIVVGDQTLESVNYNVTPQFIVACQSGSISKQEACLICPRGTYHHSASNECRLCGKGSFQDEVGQLQCKECGATSFQDQLGQTSCIACEGGFTSDDGVTCSGTGQNQGGSWVQIVIYACVGVGALLVIIIFILMVCLWQSTQEEKKQDQKRWELGHSTQLNKSYEPEEETGFRPRVNTTVSATTYQTVPEGDGTPNLGSGVINCGHELVRIPTEELYSGLTVDTHGRTLTVGVDNHPAPQPRRYQYENGYHHNHHSPSNEFMSYGHDRHNFPV